MRYSTIGEVALARKSSNKQYSARLVLLCFKAYHAYHAYHLVFRLRYTIMLLRRTMRTTRTIWYFDYDIRDTNYELRGVCHILTHPPFIFGVLKLGL